MTSVNLTRDEASHRSGLIDVAHYDVELDLRDEQYFTSVTTVNFHAKQPGSTFIDPNAATPTINGMRTNRSNLWMFRSAAPGPSRNS